MPYNKLHVANYTRVYYAAMSDVIVLKVGSQESTLTRAIQGKWLNDKCKLVQVSDKETRTPIYAHFAGILHRLLKGLDPRINPDKPPRAASKFSEMH